MKQDKIQEPVGYVANRDCLEENLQLQVRCLLV